MKTNTTITHEGKTYEIVPCAGTRCSFLDVNCDCQCNCPTWWRHIHNECTLGLRELTGSSIALRGDANDRRMFKRSCFRPDEHPRKARFGLGRSEFTTTSQD